MRLKNIDAVSVYAMTATRDFFKKMGGGKNFVNVIELADYIVDTPHYPGLSGCGHRQIVNRLHFVLSRAGWGKYSQSVYIVPEPFNNAKKVVLDIENVQRR